jgi:hypothetical protein
MKKKIGVILYLFFLVLLCGAILSMAIFPTSPMKFRAGPDIAPGIHYYPYISMMNVAYAHFFPLMVVILSFLWLLLSIVRIFYRHGTYKEISVGELISSPPIVLFCGAAAVIVSGIHIASNVFSALPLAFPCIFFAVLTFALILQSISFYLERK